MTNHLSPRRLSSRNRKKQHTEELEAQVKSSSRGLVQLEGDVRHLSAQLQTQQQSYQMLHQQHTQALRNLQMAEEEKLVTAQRHEEESSQLRKRIRLLTEEVEAGAVAATAAAAANMSANPSSVGIGDFYAGMEALSVGSHEWEQFIEPNELQTSNGAGPFPSEPSNDAAAAPSRVGEPVSGAIPLGNSRITTDATEQPVPTSLVFFLLLCGAFVASKPPSSDLSSLLHLPPNVRAVAPALLNTLLTDTTADDFPPPSLRTSRTWPSNSPLPTSNPTTTRAPPHRSANRLEHMHEHLTMATKAQEADTAFSLTASQFASISQMDLPPPPPHADPTSHHPHGVDQLGLPHHHQQPRLPLDSKADVYTRSLLWDQIPADVVRQFKDMVREYDRIETCGHVRGVPGAPLSQTVALHQSRDGLCPRLNGVGVGEDYFDPLGSGGSGL